MHYSWWLLSLWSFHQLSVADPGFPRGGGAKSRGGDFAKFPKNCLKLKEFGRGGVPRVPLRSATGYSGLHFRMDPVKLEYLSHIHCFTPVSSEFKFKLSAVVIWSRNPRFLCTHRMTRPQVQNQMSLYSASSIFVKVFFKTEKDVLFAVKCISWLHWEGFSIFYGIRNFRFIIWVVFHESVIS